MKELTYKVTFTTPAFLGNADQQAQWRTPPFKALVRHWWRVVKAKELGYDHLKLLAAENALFGAHGEKGKLQGRSALSIRLGTWDVGNASYEKLQEVNHPEVRGLGNVDAGLYLGYGPISNKLEKCRVAIQAGTSNIVRVRCPEDVCGDIDLTFKLIGLLGTLGSRNRNGWGSIQVEKHEEGEFKRFELPSYDAGIFFDLSSALVEFRLDWAAGIASLNGEHAVWRTKYAATWKEVMRDFADLKIKLRTHGIFKFNGNVHSRIEPRHILSYPITNHAVESLRNSRFPNQLCFKVLAGKEGYCGIVYHLPRLMPESFFAGRAAAAPTINEQYKVWEAVHRFVDTNAGISRYFKE